MWDVLAVACPCSYVSFAEFQHDAYCWQAVVWRLSVPTENEMKGCDVVRPSPEHWPLYIWQYYLQLGEIFQRNPSETCQHISEEVCNLSVKILRFDSLFICQQPEFSSNLTLIVLTLFKLNERILLIPIIFPFSCKSMWVVSFRTIWL